MNAMCTDLRLMDPFKQLARVVRIQAMNAIRKAHENQVRKLEKELKHIVHNIEHHTGSPIPAAVIENALTELSEYSQLRHICTQFRIEEESDIAEAENSQVSTSSRCKSMQ